jgi:hypothetical protein
MHPQRWSDDRRGGCRPADDGATERIERRKGVESFGKLRGGRRYARSADSEAT